MPKLSEGELLIQQFQDAGYSDEHIAREKETRIKAFIDAGGTMGEADTFWGDNSDEGEALATNMAVNNIKSAGIKIEDLPVADGFWETLGASWGMSVTSLQTLRTPPTTQVKAPGDMSFSENVAAGIGSLGDVPALVGGGGVTLFATKTPWKVGAGAMAFTEANRQASIYSYRTTGKWSTSAWFRGLFSAPKEVAKAAFIGATVGKAGSMAYNAALKVAGERAALVAANAAGTVAGTAMGGAVNNEVPTGAEFTAAAVVAALLPGAHYKLTAQVSKEVGARARTVLTDAGEFLSSNIQDVWAKTAIRPQDQVHVALNDKVARQSLFGRDVDGQIVAEPWSGYKSPEPEPYKKPVTEVEIDGAMKGTDLKPKKPGVDVPAEDGLIEQLVPAEDAKANPENGIKPVKSIGKEQLIALADTEMTKEVTPEQAKAMEEAAKNYKMDDGSVDLEAVLIEHSEGAAAAQLFRANGRDYKNLSPKTQRFLEYVGNEIETDGYVPPPRKPQEGGGSGKPPPPPEEGAGLPAKDKPPGKWTKGDEGPIHGNRPKEEPFARDMEFVAEDINARIAKETQSSDFKDVWRRFKANWRELSPFNAVDKMLGIGQELGSIGLERIARLQYSAEDRFQFRLQKGGGGYRVIIDKHGNPAYEADYKVPTYYAISKSAKKLKLGVDGWNAFMMALDSVDRARQGKKTTTPLNEAQEAIQAVNNMPAKERDAYWKLSRDYQAMMEDSLYGSHFHGVLSRAEIERFRKLHPNYFPQKVFIPKPPEGNLKKSVKALFRVAKGHEFMLKDPKLDTLDTLYGRERFNNTNLLRAKAAAELQKHFESGSRELVLVKPKKVESVVLREDGSVFTPEQETQFFKFNEAEIHYIADGHKMVYPVPEFPGRKVFMEALYSPSVFDRAVGIYGLTKVSAFTRAMIVFMPPYIYRMVVRDSTQHAVASKYGGIPMMNLVRGAFDMVDFAVGGRMSGGKNLGWGKAMVDEAMINGVFVGGIQHMDMNPLMRNFHDIERTGFTGALINSVYHPAELLHKLTRLADATVRVGGTYRGARDDLGAIASSDLARLRGGDMAEKSNNAVINNIASATPFWTGAARAGIDATVRAVHDDPLGYGMRGAVKITVMAVGMSALMEALEEAYDIPEINRVRNMDRKIRDNYMMIPWIWNGELYKFQLPLPQGMGALFNSPVHRIREYMETRNPRAFKEWRWNVAMGFLDTAKPLIDNPVISSILEGYTGYDISFNKPVVAQRFEHVTGFNAYHPYTSEVAKDASRWVGEPGLDLIDVTPIMVEQQIKNFTGTMGKDLLRLYDINMKDTVAPADWANTPFIGGFFTRHPGLNSRPITDFYDELNTFRTMVGDSRIAKSRYDVPAMIKAELDETMLVGMDEAAEAMRVMQGLSYGIMDAKREAYKDEAGKQISDRDIANDKRQQIDNLATMMIGIARVQLDMLDQMRAVRKKQEE